MSLLLAALLALSGPISEAHQRGVELYKQKQYLEAIAILQEAIKTEDAKTAEYKESTLLIGQSYFMLSQSSKAIPWLEKLPGSTEANYMLGYAYLQIRQPKLSEEAFSRL